MTEVDIPITSFQEDTFFPDTASGQVYRQFLEGMRMAIAQTVVGSDFDARTVPERLHQCVDSLAPGVIARALSMEHERGKWVGQPLTEHLALSAIAYSGSSDIRVSDAFIQDLHAQLVEQNTNFAVLGELKDVYDTTGITALFAQLNEMYARGGGAVGEDVYNLIEAVTQQPGQYTIAPKDAEALYLVCFLPDQVRQSARRLLVHNTQMAMIREELGEMSDDECEMMNALDRYGMAGCLVRDVFREAFSAEQQTEALGERMALATIAEVDALARLQELSQNGTAPRVLPAWGVARNSVMDRVSKVARMSGVGAWQTIDIGHGLSDSQDYKLAELASGRYYSDYAPTKDGRCAVILEDDPSQLRLYDSFVEARTPFSPNTYGGGDDQFDEILARSDDENVGLFLLDVQNGEDETYGVRLAEAVLRRRLEQLPDTPCEIIVWTASEESYTYASKTLRKLVERIGSRDKGINWMVGGAGRTAGHPISFEVRHKGFQVNDSLFRKPRRVSQES